MSDVPSDVYRQILLRLPAESLFRFRKVCKSWQSIIDDPSFVRSHTTNNHRTSLNLLMKTSTGTFYSFPLDSLNYVNGEQTIHATHVKRLTRPGVLQIRFLPVAECNGLILISHHFSDKSWAIWNPLTGDFHKLPHPPDIKMALSGAGIGYDSRSDDYKVVRIDRVYNTGEIGSVHQTSIYSLKSKSWKIIMNCPFHFHHPFHGVYFNGAVHWISFQKAIVALDLATEEYRELQSLPLESLPLESLSLNLCLDALDGCLVLRDTDKMRRAWVMRDYGTEQAIWVDLFSTMERSVIGGLGSLGTNWLWSLAYSNSKRQLIVHHVNTIIRWDIGKYCSKKVTIDGLPDFVNSQVIPGSIFRFNGGGSTAAERTAGTKRKRNKTSERLKLIATTIDSECMADPHVSVPLADRLEGVGDTWVAGGTSSTVAVDED